MTDFESSPILIYKPAGPTSFDIISQIRKITGIRKIGHAGTLDPLAEGLMIILIGPMCKKQDELQGLDKKYTVEAVLGITTTTYDAEGDIVHQVEHSRLNRITAQKIKAVLETFIGKQKQTVPAFSAVKVKGQKLCDKARKGLIDPTTLPKREINIYQVKLSEFKETRCNASLRPRITLQVSCSKGTYIRSLIHDLGQKLGVGAYVTKLIRTQVGKYKVEEAMTIEEFEKVKRK